MASKTDQAYEYLRQGIIAGDIPPDTALRIQTLGKSTGFGSTPVREALCRLEAEHFVISEMNRGFRSAPISIDEMTDLENSRLVIEAALLLDAMENGDDAWEANIVAAHYRLAKHSLPMDADDVEDRNAWSSVHRGFHDALLAAAGSKWMRSFHLQISEQLERFYYFTMDDPQRRKFESDQTMKDLLRQLLGIEHHTLLMQAVLDRDAKEAIKLHKEHIHFATDYFDRVFRQE